jgi:modulator of FtsH protease
MPQRSPYAQSASSVPVAALLGQVLGITGVGFLFTAAAAYLFRGLTGFGWIPMIVTFALLFVMQAVRKQPAIALLVFYAFTFFEGIFIAPVIAAYARADGSAVVINAAATTGLGMMILGGVAFTFSIDWRRFSSIAFIALIALIVVSLIAAFTHFIHPQAISWLVLGVFTLLTLIDFSRIRAGGDGLTAVDLAVSIYLDAVNIFLALLSIFGGGRRNN